MPKYDKSQFQLINPNRSLYEGMTLEELQEEDRKEVILFEAAEKRGYRLVVGSDGGEMVDG